MIMDRGEMITELKFTTQARRARLVEIS